jgi:pimeloyl-ACP methyl ester carboxylesterase
MIILSADESNTSSSDLAKDVQAKRKDFKNLYPNAKQIWVDSGHMIQVEKPEVVIDAIREVLKQ